MKRKALPVGESMTRIPQECERCDSVGDAIALMEEHQIRYLPVMSGSHLNGIVTQTDLSQARILHGDSVDTMPVSNFCQTDVLTVSPVDSIGQVAAQMLENHVRSAVVVDGGYVVGMFTATDALRALATLMH